jgi:glucose/arabinose dehydrogenase
MRPTLLASAASLLVTLSVPLIAQGAPGVEKVAEGFNRPVWVGAAPNDAEHLWVIEQAGAIWVIDRKTGERKGSFLDITPEVTRDGNEEGLLGLAFAPDYAQSGRFYVNYVNKGTSRVTRIARYQVSADPHKADAASEEILLSIRQPHNNHNGGWLGFGPDGMLYIGMGDGGSGNDPSDNGQSMKTRLGKILRIDVSGGKGYEVPTDNPYKGSEFPEIWAVGVRNPWRCSFDRKTGDFWMGDVGQDMTEEINFMPAGQGAGANYGWRLREGSEATPSPRAGGEKPKDCIDPVYEYKHNGGATGGVSVTGGFVYRGPFKELDGMYFFADYARGQLWSLTRDGEKFQFGNHPLSDVATGKRGIGAITAFGEDAEGGLYLVEQGGSVFRIVAK